VLIGGEGLRPSTRVSFAGVPAPRVRVLSPGFLIATVPAGADPSGAVVGTALAAPAITSPTPGAVDVPDHGLTVKGTAPAGTTVTVELDGAPFSGCSATVAGGAWSCTLGSIADGEHSLTATAALADGQSATSSPALIEVGGLPPATDKVNDTDPTIDYAAGWSYSSDRGYGDYDNDVHYAQANGATASWTFIGTGVKVYGELYTDQGDVAISVDGGPARTVDTVPSDGQRHADQVIWSDADLSPGQHTVTVTKLSGTYTTLDAFEADYAPSSSTGTGG